MLGRVTFVNSQMIRLGRNSTLGHVHPSTISTNSITTLTPRLSRQPTPHTSTMDRSPPRGPRGGGGGAGGRRGGGGGGGRDNERYGGRATDPYHPSRKRSRSRSPESRNYRDHYRERGDRDRGEREYPKHDGGRGGPDRGESPFPPTPVMIVSYNPRRLSWWRPTTSRRR